MSERIYHLYKVIQRIPLFEGLELYDIQCLLRVSELKNYETDEVIFAKGESSDEMLVLLRGKLSVTGESGEEFAQLRPGSPIGEMGVFTGEPRSANIVAVEPSSAVVLNRSAIQLLLATHADMHLKVLQNLVRILSQRLSEANDLNESHARINRDLWKRVDELERAVLEARALPVNG